jgi:hypothetical protein
MPRPCAVLDVDKTDKKLKTSHAVSAIAIATACAISQKILKSGFVSTCHNACLVTIL